MLFTFCEFKKERSLLSLNSFNTKISATLPFYIQSLERDGFKIRKVLLRSKVLGTPYKYQKTMITANKRSTRTTEAQLIKNT